MFVECSAPDACVLKISGPHVRYDDMNYVRIGTKKYLGRCHVLHEFFWQLVSFLDILFAPFVLRFDCEITSHAAKMMIHD